MASIKPVIEGFIRERPPVKGIIRLGERHRGPDEKHPRDRLTFRTDDCPEVAAVYGSEPTELKVMVPAVAVEDWCPIGLEWWGGDKLKCRGDGESCMRYDDSGLCWVDGPCAYQDCPMYQSRDCKTIGHIRLVLPEVDTFLPYEIRTTSAIGLSAIHNTYQMVLQRVIQIAGYPEAILGLVWRLVREVKPYTYIGTNRQGQRVRNAGTKAFLALYPPELNLDQAKALHAQSTRYALPAPSRATMALPPAEADDDEDYDPTDSGPPDPEDDEGIEGEIVDENQVPDDLVPGAAPVGADLGQRTAWAALLEQAAKCGKAPAQVEQSVCRGAGKVDRFADLSVEQATTAIEALTKLVQIWQALPDEGAAEGTQGAAEARGAEEARSCPTAAQLEEYEALLGELGQVGAKVEVSLRNALKAAGSPDGAFEMLTEGQAEQALVTLRAIRDAGLELRKRKAAQAAAQAPAAAPEQSQEETPQAAPAAAATATGQLTGGY